MSNNNSTIKILVADDEQDALEFIQYNLKKEGYQVFLANNGAEAIELAQKEQPHLIILDVMMPELDGIQTCRELRALPACAKTLIVFLSARSEEFTQVMALEVGGDDFITKPIKPRLLVSKIKSILRRHNEQVAEELLITIADLEISREQFTLKKSDVLIPLPKKEFNLLYLLASKPGKVFTREEILNKVWGDVIVNDRTIDVHIRKLREKLGNEYIKTIKGIGYKFDV